MPNTTTGELKRLSTYMAGQLANNVNITGGAISNTTISGTISGATTRSTIQLDKTADTTLANVTGLVATVVPGTYMFRLALSGTANASGGWKAAFKYTGTVVSALNATAEVFTASAVAVASSTTATDQAPFIASTSAAISALVDGTMVVTTGGTVQLQFAQNASNGAASSIYVGSIMTFTRIA